MESRKKKESFKTAWQAPDQCQISLMKHSTTNPFSKLPLILLKPLPLGMSGYAKA